MPNNVYFKKGHQSALDALTTYIAGSFYLTDDTNRLYFAQSSNNLVPLNQCVHIKSGSNLPNTATDIGLKPNDIYYMEDSNMLIIYKGNDNWAQINPDTRINSSNSIIGVAAGTANNVVIATEISDDATNNARIATGDFTLVGGANVTLSAAGNEITIIAQNDNDNTTYTLDTNNSTQDGEARILLTPSTGSASYISIVGDGNVTVSSNTDGEITINGAAGIEGVANTFDEDGEFVTVLSMADGNDIESPAIVPTITYGASGTNAVFADGTARLQVYTITETNALIAAEKATMDAMRYAGMIHSASEAAAVLVSAPTYGVGTVYKAAVAFELSSPSVNAKVGDLIIAGGSNDTAVEWEVIDSGDDQILRITGIDNANSVQFIDGAYNNNNQIGLITIAGTTSSAAGAGVNVTTTVSGTNSEEVAFTVAHGAPGSGTAVTIPAATGDYIQVLGNNFDVPVITGISKDAQGHITNVTAQTYRFKDTHAQLNTSLSVASSSASANGVITDLATVGMALNLDGNPDEEMSFDLQSNTLRLSGDSNTNKITIELEWGTF